MFDINLPTLVLAALPGLGLLILAHRSWLTKARSLERDLQECTEVMTRMAETQSRVFRQLNGSVSELEERLLELSMPSDDPELPLERRHRVLTMARKGVTTDEIARKLNVPRGEAELIVDLRKFMDGSSLRAAKSNGDGKGHA